MGVKELIQKLQANFTAETIIGALSDPERLASIIHQALYTIRDDSDSFIDDLVKARKEPGFSLMMAETIHDERVPIAFVQEFDIAGNGVAVLNINEGDSISVAHAKNITHALNSNPHKTTKPEMGFLLAGPTSKRMRPNNGLEYRTETGWETFVPMAQNKAGGVIIDHSGIIRIASSEAIALAKVQNTALAVMNASLYFEDTYDASQSSMERGFEVAEEQGYNGSYNTRIGFLAQNKRDASFKYFVTRVSKGAALELTQLPPDMIDINNVGLHVYTALEYLSQYEDAYSVVALEENLTALPIIFALENLERTMPRVPVSFLFSIN